VHTLPARTGTQRSDACVRTQAARTATRHRGARCPRLSEAGDWLAGDAELLAVDDDA
jgi:hypothetical protein